MEFRSSKILSKIFIATEFEAELEELINWLLVKVYFHK